MREPRPGQGQGTYYLVLNRSCADLYEEVVRLFADESRIKVVIDRRRGDDGMTEIPTRRRRGARTEKRRANPRVMSVRLRKEA
jgi:hypothetical protein